MKIYLEVDVEFYTNLDPDYKEASVVNFMPQLL